MPSAQRAIMAANAALLLACTGCASCITVVPPTIAITGEKTAIERQIVGEYREIEPDAWVVSSVKSPVQGARSGIAGAAGDDEFMAAHRIREYNRERIRRYKDGEALGENNEGLLVYRGVARYERDREAKKTLMAVLENENRARGVIIGRSLACGGGEEVSREDYLAAARAFAQEQEQLARRGDWIQNRNGRWERKR